jgi:16S rRNA (adenine1518-N6/adenine1519-N6)-dimethyltransferase
MAQKPKLGQNFLRDQSAIQRIAAALEPLAGRTVVEIGPGQGAITRTLVEHAGQVIAVELDRELAPRLREQFPPEKLTVVEQDVLQFDFAAAAQAAGQRLLIAGNLPYYITSPILLKLASAAAHIDRSVLMVQKEVADRVVAGPRSRDYGLLSVTVQMYGPAQPLFTLPPGAFSPPPDVYSTVFRWRFEPRFEELGVTEQPFLAFVRQAFAQKRKTLNNNLRAAKFDSECIAAALASSGLSLQARAEELSLEDLARLFLALQK